MNAPPPPPPTAYAASANKGYVANLLVSAPSEPRPAIRVRQRYTADDFRNELARVERRQRWATFACVALAVFIVAVFVTVIVGLALS